MRIAKTLAERARELKDAEERPSRRADQLSDDVNSYCRSKRISGQAKADFDTTLIRLYASPAPLQQKLISGAQLQVVADAKGALSPTLTNPVQPATGDIQARFMAAMTDALNPAEARAWLKDVTLEEVDGTWVLLVRTRFVAHWIATQFDQVLRRAASAAGLAAPPAVLARAGRT